MTTTNITMATTANMLLTKTATTTTSTATIKATTTTKLRNTLTTTLSSITQATTPIIKTITTITSDPGILCFHHCNVKVFCFHLPHRCPKCKQILDTGDEVGGGGGSVGGSPERVDGTDAYCETGSETGSKIRNSTADDRSAGGGGGAGIGSSILPFRLPYPFIRASQYPCAIVLRPTTGDFLNDYNNSTDLHIAVTTSTGCVVEFDRHGLRRHRVDTIRMSDWWQCLLVGDVPEPWYDYWDDILKQICNQPDRWTIAHYQEDSHNCYTFVLAFLQTLGYDKLSAAACSKTTFCEKYIVPRTTTAGKYISLYRKLRDTGIYVHPHYQHNQHHQRHSLFKQQQQQQQRLQKHYNSLQHQQQQQQQAAQQSKHSRGKSRMNGHINGAGSASVQLANGGKLNGIILRAPNLCTIEE